MTTIYLSIHNLPKENYKLIAEFDARITEAHAHQIELKREGLPSHEDYPSRYLIWTGLALFTAGFFIAQISSIRSGLMMGAAALSVFFYSTYRAKNSNSESLSNPLEIEAEKTKKIYEAIFETLANSYIHKANFVFEKVNARIQEQNAQDIKTIFAIVKEQVDKYDQRIEPQDSEDIERITYVSLKEYAIKIVTGRKTIGPGDEYAGGYFMALSTLSWEFAYGAGMNPSVDWAPPGQLKRYFLQMKPSKDGQSWTVEKFVPAMLKPF